MIFIILVPLIVFAIFEAWGSLRSALIAASVTALAECVFTYFYFGELDSFSIASIFLVLIMAGFAFYKDSRRLFYLKPAILSFAFGGFLLISYFLGSHVLLDGVTKYSIFLNLEQQQALTHENMRRMLRIAGLTVGLSLLMHGLVSTYAALKMSRWWWLTIAGLGIYPFMLAGIVFAAILI